jgi:hypothetical protein
MNRTSRGTRSIGRPEVTQEDQPILHPHGYENPVIHVGDDNVLLKQ